ncbi:MAG TPA: 3'-5' exonuclease, partial [Candidatus Thermoplasmatota archaeon]|nr:3'-5' exonuclease [Candidatus Thermoplasmatota archaeon]
TTNFRSARRILDAANAVEPGPHPMRPRRGAPGGEPPRLRATREEGDDALAHVEALLRGGADPAEVAVLCRARHLAEPFQRRLARRLHDEDAPEGLDRVLVRTIHAAKGLEWDHVVLLGAREGGLPSDHALRVPGLLDEERRLAYVAVTRARRTFVAFAGGTPSRFLAGLTAGEKENGRRVARGGAPASTA